MVDVVVVVGEESCWMMFYLYVSVLVFARVVPFAKEPAPIFPGKRYLLIFGAPQ
jgi:hypothetical protein